MPRHTFIEISDDGPLDRTGMNHIVIITVTS